MSESKNISPLLDGFTLGAPISEHHGVVCYPAIKENTNKKFIVKVISVPASQTQFDALLLAGAYKDPGDAMGYFKDNGERILAEAEILKDLSRIEGFLPYDGWQMEPITRRRLGYEVYLVGSYKRSLDKYIRKNAFTHLEAVNLGLDLCAALSVCRQSGYLYADLKPSNIYVSEKKEFRIGDLGFLPLDALRYASLPERYFSSYTPPELTDPMVSMNLTVDTYAVGMILYQLYNDGHLPFTGIAPLETLPTPCHADYEMAEIIMKAIHPDPEQRWTDPKDLGKAIASYMQRNSVNDIPITPFIPVDVKPEDIVPVSQETVQEPSNPEETVETVAVEDTPTEPDTSDELNEASSDASEQEAPEPAEESPDLESVSAPEEEAPVETLPELPVSEETCVHPDSMDLPSEEPTPPPEDEKDDSLNEISEEVAKILSKADDIIAHEIPQDTAFPQEPQQDPFDFVKDDSEDMDSDLPTDPLMEEETVVPVSGKKKTKHYADTTRKDKFKKFLSRCFTVLILAALCAGGYWYYQNAYLQTVETISVSGTQDQITVLVDTSIEESRLNVKCIDENGKAKSSPVEGGKASFSGLQPSTKYTIRVDMSGFHKLIGNTSEVFTTDATTQILTFQAVAGDEDGSVLLDFTVDGNEPNFWNIRYSAEGEEEQLETVTTHSAMISGLTIGKVYTFTLDGGRDFDLGGKTSIQYLASRLILADNLTVTSSNGNDVTVLWNTPGDVVVESWNVRCYDGYGFEEQVTVTENKVLFTGIDSDSSYTIEITAAGMTQPTRVSISSDPIFVTDYQVDESSGTTMKVTWTAEGNPPEGGWLLTYSVDGSESQTVNCVKSMAEISPLIPEAKYTFVLQAADERTVFNNTFRHQTSEAKAFTEFKYVRENVSVDLLKTPEEPSWQYETISEDAFTNTFCIGDSASMVLRSSSAVYLPSNKVNALFIFRDAYGYILPDVISDVTYTWKDIWFDGDKNIGEIDIPKLPAAPGQYTLELYFNGCLAAEFGITMVP